MKDDAAPLRLGLDAASAALTAPAAPLPVPLPVPLVVVVVGALWVVGGNGIVEGGEGILRTLCTRGVFGECSESVRRVGREGEDKERGKTRRREKER